VRQGPCAQDRRAVRISNRIDAQISKLVRDAHGAGDDLTRLASLFGDDDPWVRLYAAIYMLHFDPDAAEPVLRSIEEPVQARLYAKLMLGEMPGGRPPLAPLE
jgi:hypothetical protein